MKLVNKPKHFSNSEELIQFLCALSFKPTDRVGIVAGHFMLMYDNKNDCLVPMIYQDAQNEEVENFSREMAGDFPINTFKLGLSLFKQLRAKQIGRAHV